MIARRDLMKAAAVLPVVAGLAATPLAWADSGKGADHAARARPRVLLTNEVLSGTLTTAGSTYQDAAGNTYVAGAIYTGSSTGPITGTFRAALNVYTPAGSSTSHFLGSIVIADGATPANIVFGSVSGEQEAATTGYSETGHIAVNGGLGNYLSAHSHGTLLGGSTVALNANGSLNWTLNSVPAPRPHPGQGKGHDR